MPTYTFRCTQGEVFDITIPMRDLRPAWDCPACGRPAARVYGAPALGTLGAGAHRAADLAAASAERPMVVRRPAGGPDRRDEPARRGRSRYPALPRP